MNYGVVVDSTDPARISANARNGTKLDHRPNVPGYWVYVETGDPNLDTDESPEWLNGFTFVEGFPVAFRHGLDGQTDMIGMYDLVTDSPVTNTTAFLMPLKWANQMPPSHAFPLELDDGVWTFAVQIVDTVNLVSGKAPVKIVWPIVADPVP